MVKKKKKDSKLTVSLEFPRFITENKKKIYVVLLIILALFTGYYARGIFGGVVLDADTVSGEAMTYINTYLLQGATAELISVTETDSGVYVMKIDIGGAEYDSYITNDGKLLFPSGVDLNETPENVLQTGAFDALDVETPNVKFFVMSFCPFGNQAEEGLKPVFELLSDKVEWEPHYVIYSSYGTGYPDYCLDREEKYCSLHGIQELNQGVRELCVWKYQPELWWEFVFEVNDQCDSTDADECWEPIAKEVGIDTEQIKACQEDEAMDLLEIESQLNEQFGVQGSPTVFVNDELYTGERTPEAYKQGVCSGFVTAPEECLETLEGGEAAAGQC